MRVTVGWWGGAARPGELDRGGGQRSATSDLNNRVLTGRATTHALYTRPRPRPQGKSIQYEVRSLDFFG